MKRWSFAVGVETIEEVVVSAFRAQAAAVGLALALLISSCGNAHESLDTSMTARFTYSCADLACEFDTTDSHPDDESIVWSFGDGASSTSRNPSHSYAKAGTFEVMLTVTGSDGTRVDHVEQLTIAGTGSPDAGEPVTELAFGAVRAGRYITNWAHLGPAVSLTIEDGWWVSDTLEALTVAPLIEQRIRACDPFVQIVVPQAIYDPTTHKMVPFDDLEHALRSDARMSVTGVTATEVGGFPATRIDGILNPDKVDLSWRFCGPNVRTYAVGASNLDDPSYKWVWLPAHSHLSFWVVHVEASDVLIAVKYQDPDELLVEEMEMLVGSVEFHVPEESALTKTLRSEFGDIEIFTGTPGLHSLVDWSVGRFVESDLGSPAVARVTFSAGVDCRTQGYAGGFTETSGSGSHVRLCFGEERPRSLARLTLLHEFAHAWLEVDPDEAARAEFLSLFDLAAWHPSELGPTEAGVEYACDVIAWGLLGESDAPRRLADRTCGELDEAFRMLTGTEPLTAPAVCNR